MLRIIIALYLLLPSCKVGKKAEPAGEFSILESEYSESRGTLRVKYSDSEGAEGYRIWISDRSDCEFSKTHLDLLGDYAEVSTAYLIKSPSYICAFAYGGTESHITSCGPQSEIDKSTITYASNHGMPIEKPPVVATPLTKIESPPRELSDSYYLGDGFQQVGNILASVSSPFFYSITENTWSKNDLVRKEAKYYVMKDHDDSILIFDYQGESLQLKRLSQEFQLTTVFDESFPDPAQVVGIAHGEGQNSMIYSDGNSLFARTIGESLGEARSIDTGSNLVKAILTHIEARDKLFSFFENSDGLSLFINGEFIRVTEDLTLFQKDSLSVDSRLPFGSMKGAIDMIYRSISFGGRQGQIRFEDVPAFCSPALPPPIAKFFGLSYPNLQVRMTDFLPPHVDINRDGVVEYRSTSGIRYFQLAHESSGTKIPILETKKWLLFDSKDVYLLDLSSEEAAR